MNARVSAIGKGGAGVVHLPGRTLFVAGALPGETIECTVDGELLRVIEPASERVDPPCPHYGQCGGCNFQHIAYAAQLRFKKEILSTNLQRIGRQRWEREIDVLPSPPWRYRCRTTFKLAANRVGFFRKRSHEVVSISACRLVPTPVEEFILRIALGAAESPHPAGELIVLSDGCEVAALRRGGGRCDRLGTPAKLTLRIKDFAYNYAPENFIQSNRHLLGSLLELAEVNARQAKGGTAVDLFCGVGFFSIPLSRRFRHVFAVDNDESNIAACRENQRLNSAHNLQVLCADSLKASLPRADLYLVDPPRPGLGRRLIERLVASRPPLLIYFSCDSATFARDAALLDERRYVLQELKLIDNFPQTDHFEIFSVFRG